MTRESRRARRASLPLDDDSSDVSMDDVTKASLPADVPQHSDGTAKLEGELPIEQVRKIGAVDIASAGANKSAARKMRDAAVGKPVRWNEKDAQIVFSQVKMSWPGDWNSMLVMVTRTEPAPSINFPSIMAANLKTEIDLYEYVRKQHGAFSGVAVYRIDFRVSGQQRGSGFITLDGVAPVVQMIDTPQTSHSAQHVPQGYGYPPPGYPPYYPPPQAPQERVFVVNPPAAPLATPSEHAPVPQPYPPPVGFDPMRTLFEMMQASQTAQAAQMKELAEIMRRPAPPAGFIGLPSEEYPVPPGYVRVPGGMIPAPPMAAYVPVVAPPAPVAAPAPVVQAAPVQAPAPVHAIVPAPTPQDQIGSAVKQIASAFKGFQEIQHLMGAMGGVMGGGLGVAAVDEDLEPETPAPEPPSPKIVQDLGGGAAMIIDRQSGKTDWAATLMGAAPKIMDVGKSALSEYNKLMERQSQQAKQRIELANAIAVAQGRIPAPAPAQMAPAPVQQVPVSAPPAPPPQQAAPAPAPTAAPAPEAPPPPKTKVSVPTAPLW